MTSDYFAAVSLDPPLDRDGLRRLALLACTELYRVEWRTAWLADDGTRVLALYRAPDAEAVRFVLRQQGTGGVPVRPCRIDGTGRQQPAEAGRRRMVLELDAAADESEAVRDVVTGAGCRDPLVLEGTGGGPAACIVGPGEADAAAKALSTAGRPPSGIWPCVELDPNPPPLFARTRDAGGGARDAGVRASAAIDGRSDAASVEHVDAVIIGAGLSGLCALQKLLSMGLSVRLYEAGDDVGGVWHWNRYPGARVDSESYTYGFSFSPTVLREWHWQELFAAQPEVEAYLRFVADRLGLRPHMRLSTRVERASYGGPDAGWAVETDRGERVSATYLIAGTGTLSAIELPDYPGAGTFRGASHHTARWPAGLEIAGRRVGVIGTGASGVQVIQTIAPDVAHLTVFQRTPTWCLPQRNRPFDDADRTEIERDLDAMLARCSTSFAGFVHDFEPEPGLMLSAAEREARFEALWNTPGFAFWLGNYGDLMMNAEVNEHACEFLRRKIRERVHDPDVARRLTPDHPLGCKRVPLENGYYETFNRDNVTLVDLRETPIERITETGIRTTSAEHALDVIVYATGFDAGTGAFDRIDIRGEGGQRLADKWGDGPRTYLGLMVAGFPNLFIVNGPQNAATLCNAGRCIEQNVDWIGRCIAYLRERGLTFIDPSESAEREWTAHVDEVADSTVLARMKESWFYGAPGKPRRVAVYAAGARHYREHCERAAAAGYLGCRLG